MFRTNGGLIGNRRIPSKVQASGTWSLMDQSLYRRDDMWPGTDPFLSEVILLLQLDGGNNSTTFQDTSLSPKTVNRWGNIKISTDQFKFGGASAFFDGTGDYLTLNASPLWDLSSTDFTVECFIYILPAGTKNKHIISQDSATWRMAITTDGKLEWATGNNFARSSASLELNTWHHVAAVSYQGITTLYASGVAVAQTSERPASNNNQILYIGKNWVSGTWDFPGYMDSIRITRAARYRSNFTPPELPFTNGTAPFP